MTNILSGNMAGVFSGFLSYLSWMEISDQQENNINVQLHARNKTHYSGNTYSNYRWFNSKECNNFEDILSNLSNPNKVAIAVSGGSDSMALCFLISCYKHQKNKFIVNFFEFFEIIIIFC